MESQIKITAEILQHDKSSCRFIVERPLLPQGFVRFRDAAGSKGSPLAEALFAVEGVIGVMIQHNEITVTSQEPVDWRKTGPLIGAAIRAFVQSGKPAISEDALKSAPPEDVLRQKVQTFLDVNVNPAVASHGGFITLLDVKGSDLYIQMGGGCQGCGMANVTLREGVESSLRQSFPEIGQIFDITDHSSGDSPYYSTQNSGR